MPSGDKALELLGAVWRGRVTDQPADQADFSTALLGTLPIAVLLEDRDGRVLWANHRFEAILGIAEGESVGSDIAEFVATEDLTAFLEFRRNAHAGATAYVEFAGLRPDGSELWMRLTANRVDDAEEPTVVLAGEDITSERSAERARDQAKALYRELVETSSDLVWEVDADGRWTFINAVSWDIYGAVPTELLGQSAADRLERGTESPDPVALVLAGNVVSDVETSHLSIAGQKSILSFTGTPILDRAGDVIGARGTARNVTARAAIRETSAKLERHLALLRSLINNTPDLIFYKDPHGVYRGCNHAFEDYAGLVEAEIVGRSDGDLFSEERARLFIDSDQEVIDSGKPSKYEEWVTYPDGRRVLLDTLKMPFFTGDGEFLGLLGLSRDLTDRKLIEEQLQELAAEAERATRMKSAFLANMSHEIRTPMNGVLGMTELLLSTELDGQQQQSADLIKSSAESLLRILDDILDFSKIEAGQLLLEETPFDLWATVDAAARVLAVKAAGNGTELFIDVHEEVPRWVIGDPIRLRQVITNLASNAVKFTDGGEVVVEASLIDGDAVSARVRLSVRDTGIGIAEDKAETIFAEFQQADTSTTRNYGGTGLGLAISRRIVGLMGSELALDTELGAGSDFHFTVDVTVSEAPEGATDEAKDAAILRGKRVLVVDDHRLNRQIARGFLEASGVEVFEAESAMEALAMLRRAVDDENGFHAALIDFLMPEVDGFGLANRVQADEALQSTPMVMLTSADRPEDAARAQAMGVTYLTKPIARAELTREMTGAVATGPRVVNARSAKVRVDKRYTANILLAEDNQVNQMVARSLLEKRGHSVVVVEDGEKAVDAVTKGDYDVVLMDVQMPVLDGIGATAKIRALPVKNDVPIIALTAHALESERKRCLEAGMDGFVSKPFRPEELFGAVEDLIDKDDDEGADGDEEAPVRLDRFRALMREAGVEEIVEETLRVYLDESPKRLEQLRTAVEGEDGSEVESIAHALKSASLNIWAVRLAEDLEEIESAGVSGDLARARSVMPSADAHFSEVVEYLRGEVGDTR